MPLVVLHPVFTFTFEIRIDDDELEDFPNTVNWLSARRRLMRAIEALPAGVVDDPRASESNLRVVFEHLAAIRPDRGDDEPPVEEEEP